MIRERRMDKGRRRTFPPLPVLDADGCLRAIIQFGIAYAI
jgi:hypothetical protein